MITFPPAKINLGLRILNKRSDGYHTLETLFVPIALCDVLEVTPAPKEKKDQLLVREIPLEGDPAQNTVLRTLDLLRKLVPEIPPPNALSWSNTFPPEQDWEEAPVMLLI